MDKNNTLKKERNRLYRLEHKDYFKDYSKKNWSKYAGKRNKKKYSDYMKKYKKAHPLETKARKLLEYAVKTGKIIKKQCLVCGEKKVVGHHDDYLKPLEVKWLCRKHHYEFHKKNYPKTIKKCIIKI